MTANSNRSAGDGFLQRWVVEEDLGRRIGEFWDGEPSLAGFSFDDCGGRWMGRSWFRRRPAATESTFPAPWESTRPSISGFLTTFDVPDGGTLPVEAQELPDEPIVVGRSSGGVRWAPGALDGVFGHHAGAGDAPDADRVAQHLARAVNTRSARSVKDFYDSVADGQAASLVDPLRTRVALRSEIAPDRLRAFAAWLVTESPDRDAVKVGIALLGMVTPLEDTATLLELGVHDEFTLYVAVALGALPDPEAEELRWWLARRVDGWGRIHLVERLAGTERDDIRDWMLREGYRNAIMYEYLAYTCAVAGGLHDALRPDDIDDALLRSTGQILSALIHGGPAEDMSDYPDGAEAAHLYLRHLSRRAPGHADEYLTVVEIRDFAADSTTGSEHAWRGDQRAEIMASAVAILADPRWTALVADGLRAEDDQIFWSAAFAADHMGLDAWPARFDRLVSGDSAQIFHLMRTEDPARIRQVIDWATTTLELDAISTGPALEIGLGPEYSEQTALGMILQDLGRFPGAGWVLVDAGLKSPVIRNRTMAINTLQAWPSHHWPQQAREAVLAARNVEPDPGVQRRLNELLI